MSSIPSSTALYSLSSFYAASSSSPPASSSSSAPPPLDLSGVIGITRSIGKLTGSDRSSLSSSERQKGKTISRSESYQPLKIPSLAGDSPKRSTSLIPRMFLTEEELEHVKQEELARVQAVLVEYYRTLNNKRLTKPLYVMVLDSETWSPSWRNLSGYKRKAVEKYLVRAEQALWKLVSNVEIFLDAKCELLAVPVKGKKQAAENVSISVIFDKCIRNQMLLHVINMKENLRYKISRCYLRVMMNSLYEDCASICQTLDNFENYELFKGLERLKRFAYQRSVLLAQNRVASVSHDGEDDSEKSIGTLISELSDYEESCELARSVDQLSFDVKIETEIGQKVLVKNLFLECRTKANEIINKTLEVKEKVHEPISRGEDLGVRLKNALNLGPSPGLMTLNFEKGFRMFVEQSLIFLAGNFREDMEELHVDLAKIQGRLNAGIRKPYKWTELSTVLTQLNYIVSKLVRKHNNRESTEFKGDIVVATPKRRQKKSQLSVQQEGFMGSPRKGSWRRL